MKNYTRPHINPPSSQSAWVPYARYTINNYGHAVWEVSPNRLDDKKILPVHRLLAVAEHGFDAVAGKVVHHKNGIPWDNRIENLELVTREKHAHIHHSGRIKTTNEDLLLDLRAGAEALGYPPRPTDIKHFGDYLPATYKERFGSWAEALEAAGLDPKECPAVVDD